MNIHTQRALRNRELRKAMLLALSREMATKEDIEELKSYVDARINDVNRRISDLYVVKASRVAIIATLISTILVPLLLRILFHT